MNNGKGNDQSSSSGDIVLYPIAQKSYDEIIHEITYAYLTGMTPQKHPRYEKMQSELSINTRIAFQQYNLLMPSGLRFKVPTQLSEWQIAMILDRTQTIISLNLAEDETVYDLNVLAIFQYSGINEGIYSIEHYPFSDLARKLKSDIKKTELDNVKEILMTVVPHKVLSHERDIIPLNNGLFDFERKKLMSFSPDHIFLGKIRIDYNPNATNPKMINQDGTTWDVDTWINSLSDDPEVVELLWQIIAASVRSNVSFSKSLWLYGTVGCNGKGTYCELLSSFCINPVSISLKQLEKEFALERVINSNAIIVHEIAVDSYVDDSTAFKCLVTGDTVNANRKHKSAVMLKFRGITVFCVNGFPRVRDKTDSFARRLLIVPFDHSFIGAENKDIKEKYVKDKNVLEYILYRVLNMNFNTFSEPLICQQLLAEFLEMNDPVLQFMNELMDQFKWDLLPFDFLYEAFKCWYRENVPCGSIIGKNTFIRELVSHLDEFPDWTCNKNHNPYRVDHFSFDPEPLISELDITAWMDHTYTGRDVNKLCTPRLKPMYRGIVRTNKQISSNKN